MDYRFRRPWGRPGFGYGFGRPFGWGGFGLGLAGGLIGGALLSRPFGYGYGYPYGYGGGFFY